MNVPNPSVHDEFLRGLVSKNQFGTFFGVSQKVLDEVWINLTAPDGNSVIYISMEIGADPDVFNPVKNKLQSRNINVSPDPELDRFVRRFISGWQKIPNYSGGLGILAGDTLKSYADCKTPVTAISLLFKKGYFTQLVDSQVGQIAWSSTWEPEKTPGLYLLKSPQNPQRPLVIEVPFLDERGGRTVMAYPQVWLNMEINENLDFFIPIFLLDYSTPDTPEWIRAAAGNLYDSSSERIKAIQRRMLGAGILSTCMALGLTANTLHLNEQHGAVAILNLIAEYLLNKLGADYENIATEPDIIEAAVEVASRVVYTIHTPVKAGHDRFSRALYAEIGHKFCNRVLTVLALAQDEPSVFNFTSLAMRINRATNSVSRLHKEVTKAQFPQFAGKITAITNGVHHLTWITDAKARVFDQTPELADWRNDPGVFGRAESLRANKEFIAALEQAWAEDTKKLIRHVNEMLIMHRRLMQETWIDPPNFFSHLDIREGALSSEVFTLGFARRFSTYKRANLIFSDLDALAAIILKKGRPVNFLFAGKAHPSDEPGKNLIKLVLDVQEVLYKKTQGLAKLVFIPGYDMYLAKLMVSGVHAWLNNPKRPLEASGTSGMKAALNGVPNISILDGWWAEGYHGGKTGWKFGNEEPVDVDSLSEDQAELLYNEDSASFYQLFSEILEIFYDPGLRPQYLDKCIMNLVLNGPIFNTHRMAAEYINRYGLKLPPETERRMAHLRGLYQSEIDK